MKNKYRIDYQRVEYPNPIFTEFTTKKTALKYASKRLNEGLQVTITRLK